MNDCPECQKLRDINNKLQQIIAIFKSGVASGEQRLDEFIANANDLLKKIDFDDLPTKEEIRLAEDRIAREMLNSSPSYIYESDSTPFAWDSKTLQPLNAKQIKERIDELTTQEQAMGLYENNGATGHADFPFGPIPHWVFDKQPDIDDSPVLVFINGSLGVWIWSPYPEGWYDSNDWVTLRKECPLPWMKIPLPPPTDA